MRRFAGACRFVFNRALAFQKENHSEGNKYIPYTKMASWLIEWKACSSTDWLKESPSQVLQQSLKDLERAYQNFFEKRASFPCFKKRGQKDTFRYPQGVKLEEENRRIFLPKLGWIRYRKSRAVLGEIKNVTVSFSAGKWFVSIQTQREVQAEIPTGNMVGIDMGIHRFATLSDGSYVTPLNSFKRHQISLAKAQRQMSQKQKFSQNWIKSKRKIQKIHSRIANVRKDFLHKTSTAISKNHAVVVMEDLQIRNMSKSATGTLEQPGKNVRAKSGLNRSILDQGWYEFRRQVDYKLAWKGGYFIEVSPQNTSRTCPHCTHVAQENRPTQARFECVACRFKEHADLVGAMNILKRGEKKLEGLDSAHLCVPLEKVTRIACEVNDATRSSAAGTHRSERSHTAPSQ